MVISDIKMLIFSVMTMSVLTNFTLCIQFYCWLLPMQDYVDTLCPLLVLAAQKYFETMLRNYQRVRVRDRVREGEGGKGEREWGGGGGDERGRKGQRSGE